MDDQIGIDEEIYLEIWKSFWIFDLADVLESADDCHHFHSVVGCVLCVAFDLGFVTVSHNKSRPTSRAGITEAAAIGVYCDCFVVRHFGMIDHEFFSTKMMKIQIIQVGKTKDPYLTQVASEFRKRLGRFCTVEISELASAGIGSNMPRKKIVAEDSMKIARVLPKNAFVVVLDEKGKGMSSVGFSEVLGRMKDEGRTLVFVIGGAFGLSEGLKKEADLLLSMSEMTFTHQMIRVFLLEQIYRGFCILSGKEYHY